MITISTRDGIFHFNSFTRVENDGSGKTKIHLFDNTVIVLGVKLMVFEKWMDKNPKDGLYTEQDIKKLKIK